MAMAVQRERIKAAPSSVLVALRRVRGDRLATKASHVRARLLFMILDVMGVAAGYGVAEVAFLRDRPPAEYWQHFFLFLALALVVHLGANWAFGLYGRIWRYAGIEEARQVLLSALVTLLVLAALRPVWRMVDLERIPLRVVFVGCAFVTMAMGGLRFPVTSVRLAAGHATGGAAGGDHRQPRRRSRGHQGDAAHSRSRSCPGGGLR